MKLYFLSLSGSLKGPIKYGFSIRPSVCLSKYFLGIGSLFFIHFGMVLETHMKLSVTEPGFWGKKDFLPPKLGLNGPKIRFLECIEKFGP